MYVHDMQAALLEEAGRLREMRRHELAQREPGLARTRMATLAVAPPRDVASEASELRGAEDEAPGGTGSDLMQLDDGATRGASRATNDSAAATRGTTTPSWQRRSGVCSGSLPWLLDSYVSTLTLGHEGLRDGMPLRMCTLAAALTVLPRTVEFVERRRALTGSATHSQAGHLSLGVTRSALMPPCEEGASYEEEEEEEEEEEGRSVEVAEHAAAQCVAHSRRPQISGRGQSKGKSERRKPALSAVTRSAKRGTFRNAKRGKADGGAAESTAQVHIQAQALVQVQGQGQVQVPVVKVPLLPARTAHWAAMLELTRADAAWLLSLLKPILRASAELLVGRRALLLVEADHRNLLTGLSGVWHAGGTWFTQTGVYNSVVEATASIVGVAKVRTSAPPRWRKAVLVAGPARPVCELLAPLVRDESEELIAVVVVTDEQLRTILMPYIAGEGGGRRYCELKEHVADLLGCSSIQLPHQQLLRVATAVLTERQGVASSGAATSLQHGQPALAAAAPAGAPEVASVAVDALSGGATPVLQQGPEVRCVRSELVETHAFHQTLLLAPAGGARGSGRAKRRRHLCSPARS